MNWPVIIIVIVVVLLALYVLTTYNRLVRLRNRKDGQWAQIDVQLKRRADLIPNLVETVKGYAKHEKGTFEEVVKARNTYVSAGTVEEEMQASGELTKALNKLLALTENYPELKANENFLKLQGDLADTENKIMIAREFYNDTGLTYNNAVEMFPSNVIAKLFGFQKAAYFEATTDDRKAPEVKF